MKKTYKKDKNIWQDIVELARFTFFALIIIVPIRIFIAQPFVVSGESMLPTFENKDYLIIDEISYRFKDPQRGEVIVFRYPENNRRFLIKRIIGLPGETVSISGKKINIEQEDGTSFDLNEDYINGEFSSYGTWKLGEEEYFVLGDNRNASSDSRSWGLLDKKLILGKTFLRLLPFSKISHNPGEKEEKEIIINKQEKEN